MGSSQSSYATNNNDNRSSTNHKKSWSSKSRSVRGRKSINTTITKNTTTGSLGSAPHGLRASIVSLPSEQLDHILDITSAESVHSDDVVDVEERLTGSNENLMMEHSDDDSAESSDNDDDDDVLDNADRLRILDEMRQLKSMASFFLHPELPVTSSGIESARCFFDRYSFTFNDGIDADERATILADVTNFKESARHFLHPEATVVATDPYACGRNYFSRFSSPDQDVDDSERSSILADATALRRSAARYLHPEIPITSAATCARNYFTRPSAPEYECDGMTRNEIMQDVADLRKGAMNYLHPEIQMVPDASSFGRNYFMRQSAPNQESLDEVTERNEIVHDTKLLQQAAEHFMHPELSVMISDPTFFGRNYFMRASAPTQETLEDVNIAQQVLEDNNAFHQLAIEYLHPELPLIIYATSSGRNYFTRGSGAEYKSLKDVEARSQIMEDLKKFKLLACDFLHPELPVVVYATSTGRNYFTRPDAENIESVKEMVERELIMADVNSLKQSAAYFLHPELSVTTSDGTACGRNYFSRISSPEYETETERDYLDLVLADTKNLRQSAVDFKHPEIVMVKSIACARNYFSRASADEYEDLEQTKERYQCLAEARSLKRLAVDYMHPELPCVTNDGTAFGRNFFTRFTAIDSNEDEERLKILADAAALKKLAVDFLHPECGVTSSVTITRNYFDRPSSKLHNLMIHSFPAHYDDDDNSDHHHSEHIDHFGLMDEEMELYHDLRAELEAFPMIDNSSNNRSAAMKYCTNNNKADSEVGSNLSRSPSSVFLFGLDDAGYE